MKRPPQGEAQKRIRPRSGPIWSRLHYFEPSCATLRHLTDTLDTVASITMDGSPLLDLPPELRLQIYKHALYTDSTLQRPQRAPRLFEKRPAVAPATLSLSLLRTCNTICADALDVFYEINSFRVSYNHICYCEAHYPYPINSRVGELAITDFLPRVDEPQTCKFCADSGYGLIKALLGMPKLRKAHIAFAWEGMSSFTESVPVILAQLRQPVVASDTVGIIQLPLSKPLSIELPILTRAWAYEARAPGAGISVGRTMQTALRYLQFEANSFDRTPAALLPFFVPSREGQGSTNSLRFSGLPDGRRRRAEFTIALASVLNDIFAEFGGSDSIDWRPIEGSGAWTFWVDNYNRRIGGGENG